MNPRPNPWPNRLRTLKWANMPSNDNGTKTSARTWRNESKVGPDGVYRGGPRLGLGYVGGLHVGENVSGAILGRLFPRDRILAAVIILLIFILVAYLCGLPLSICFTCFMFISLRYLNPCSIHPFLPCTSISHHLLLPPATITAP